jgi:hypothetical protein
MQNTNDGINMFVNYHSTSFKLVGHHGLKKEEGFKCQALQRFNAKPVSRTPISYKMRIAFRGSMRFQSSQERFFSRGRLLPKVSRRAIETGACLFIQKFIKEEAAHVFAPGLRSVQLTPPTRLLASGQAHSHRPHVDTRHALFGLQASVRTRSIRDGCSPPC